MPELAMGAADEGRDEDRTLALERLLPGTPERVFDAFTDPAILSQWWGPEGFTAPDCRVDPRPGGDWRTVLQSASGDRACISGAYRVVDRPRRLVMTWAWEEEGGARGHETVVELTFEPVGRGTRLSLVQRLFRSPADRDNHFGGWTSSLVCLERLLKPGM